jgi:sodium-dependent dicarboxylate transporter 2/3/5
MGVMSGSAVASTYFSDSIIICWGSLIIAYSVEKYELHRRFACMVLRFAYVRETKARAPMLNEFSDELLLFSFIMITAFISMWLSNSATAVLMTPLAKAVQSGLQDADRHVSCRSYYPGLEAIIYLSS